MAEPGSQTDEQRGEQYSGRIAQDAEVVGQRPEAPRYEVEDDMTARRFAARSSPGLDGGKDILITVNTVKY